MIQQHITRRRIVLGTAVLATAGTGLALGTDRAGAQASVSTDGLKVEPAEFSPEDGELFSPWVLITGEFEYRVGADPAEWQVFLLVYDGGGNSEAVGLTEGDATAREGSGTYALRGPITAASFWGPEDFRVPDGQESITVSVPVEVVLVIRDAAGDMLIQAREADDAVVTVNRDGQVMAALDGSATIYAQDDSDDPTPSLPEA